MLSILEFLYNTKVVHISVPAVIGLSRLTVAYPTHLLTGVMFC